MENIYEQYDGILQMFENLLDNLKALHTDIVNASETGRAPFKTSLTFSLSLDFLKSLYTKNIKKIWKNIKAKVVIIPPGIPFIIYPT